MTSRHKPFIKTFIEPPKNLAVQEAKAGHLVITWVKPVTTIANYTITIREIEHTIQENDDKTVLETGTKAENDKTMIVSPTIIKINEGGGDHVQIGEESKNNTEMKNFFSSETIKWDRKFHVAGEDTRYIITGLSAVTNYLIGLIAQWGKMGGKARFA